jgi:ABC-type glycerol-3-phosphate transport system substrate-binding protein
VEEKLNINLELAGTNEATYPQQITAMIAANDLPDIFYFSNVTQQLPMVHAAKAILRLDPYLTETWAPNTLADIKGRVMFETMKVEPYSPDGGVWTWGLCKGSWDDGTQPTSGQFLQWDVYKKAGYPKLENFDNDLVDVLEKMVKAEPVTRNGQKTYGVGDWFGDGPGWGERNLRSLLYHPEGVVLNTTTGYTFALDVIKGEPLNQNQMKDPNSHYWRAVRFYNKCFQRGLLDPDSFTQKQDITEQKMRDGVYMFINPGWDAGTANAEFNKYPGNEKAFISLPSIGSKVEYRYRDMLRGERTYGISSKTKYPERCIALLDFVSTYDFSRAMFNGLEGNLWKMVDGKPVPTDDYLATSIDDPYRLKHGVQIFHHFMGYGNGSIDPANGVPVDLWQYSPQAVAKKLTASHQDFLNYYKAADLVQLYIDQKEATKGYELISFGNPPEDLKNNINNLDIYRGMNVFKMITAPNDAEFNKMLNDFIAGLENYNVDRIFKYFYDSALGQVADTQKYIKMLQE